MKIRQSTEKDFKKMMSVAKKLHPKWFDNFAISKSIPLDLKIHKGFVAQENGSIVGFITYTSKDGIAEISWLGVIPKFHRKKIGTKLLESLEKELKKLGAKELHVDTVADSVQNESYLRTRAFYSKVGFKVKSVKRVKSKDTGKIFDMATFVKDIK